MPLRRITKRKNRIKDKRKKSFTRKSKQTTSSHFFARGGDSSSGKDWILKITALINDPSKEKFTNFNSLKNDELKITDGLDYSVATTQEPIKLKDKGLVVRHLLSDLINKDFEYFSGKMKEIKHEDVEQYNFLSNLESQLRGTKVEIEDQTNYPLYIWFLMMNVEYKIDEITPQLFVAEKEDDEEYE